MDDKDLQRYVEIGLTADVADKARNVQAAMNHTRMMFERASGLYIPSRFRETCDNLKQSIDAFMNAMQAKEAYASARRKVDPSAPQEPEDGGVVPVHSEQEGENSSQAAGQG